MTQPPRRPAPHELQYWIWSTRNLLDGREHRRQRLASACLARRPLISVLTPVYNTEPALLWRTIASVRRQSYPYWELCLVDDASTRDGVADILGRADAADPRIRVLRRGTNGGIVAASNDALAMAQGEFVALLDHDDELAPDALFAVAELVDRHPDADMIYSDEDKLDADGRPCEPFFKPDWSPEYFLTCMYTAHLGVYRRALALDVGAFRPGYEGSQDYDLVLRIADRTARIHHIPRILYHWRITPESTSAGHGNKTYAHAAGRRALADWLLRNGIEGVAEDNEVAGCYRVRFRVLGEPLVSIVIPTAGRVRETPRGPLDLIVNCVESIVRRTDYPNYEIVAVTDGELAPETATALRGLVGERLRLVPYHAPFNFSEKINLGALHAGGEYLLLLNDDVEPLADEWLRAMLELAQRRPIGAVGAKLHYPTGEVQHAGVVVMDGAPHHVLYRWPEDSRGYYNNLRGTCNYSAVTAACLMTRRDVFFQVGGMNPEYAVNFNDVDFCLKVREAGYRLVFTPFARLTHYESLSRSAAGVGHVEAEEVFLLRRLWGMRIGRDPYYNQHFRQDSGMFALAYDDS